MQPSESVHRATEIEDFTNLYFVHRIAGFLTPRLAKLHVHPNTVSFTGMAFGLGAAFAYYHYQSMYWAICGFALMVGWHVLDGVDGQLARLTQTQSEFGKVIDGLCDNLTFIAVYIGLGLALAQEGMIYIWAVLLLAGALHSIQSAAYEAQRQEFDFWGCNKQSAELKDPDLRDPTLAAKPFVKRVAAHLAARYTRTQRAVAGINWEVRKQLEDALHQQPDHEEAIRRRYRETFASSVRCWSVLSANYRTIGIFAFAVFHVPLWYFVVEIFVLTPTMFLLMRARRKPNAQFAQFLSGLTS